MDAIAAWWRAFQAHALHFEARFKRREEWDVAEWMHDHLRPVHSELMWEFGPAVHVDGHRLVITPERRKDLRPLVRELIQRAPAIPGWEFYEYRLPEDLKNAAAAVEGRTDSDLRLMQAGVKRSEHHLIDVVFNTPPHWDQSQARNAAFVACESLLGEEWLDRWVGYIDANEPSVEVAEWLQPEDLRGAVATLIAEIQEEMPERPWHEIDLEKGCKWSMLELNPDEAEDYADRLDAFVYVTPYLTLCQNILSNYDFDSHRYSRCGETFCYLKIDGVDGLEGSSFADRAEIEDAINRTLRPLKLGSTVGGGTGRRYSYIDLALADVYEAWPILSSVLSRGRLPRRTWLLHSDAYLQTEWRGLYDDTPPPPERESRE